MTQVLRAHMAMVLFALAISGSYTIGDMAALHIAPSVLTALRFVIAAVFLGLIALPLLNKKSLERSWRYLIVGALLAGYFILMFEALRLTDPVSTSAVFTLTPIMSAVFGYLLLRQVTTVLMAIALCVAGAGAIWVIFRADVHAILGLKLGQGEQLFFIGCAIHALYPPMSRLLNRGEPVILFSFLSVCGGLLLTAVYGLPEMVSTDWTALPPIAWIAVVYLGIVTTAGTVLLLQYATLRLPSGKVMAYGYLVPVFVILWEGLLGHGWIRWAVVPGVVAILIALLLLVAEKDHRSGNT